MSNNQRVLFVIFGLFTIAIIVNVFLSREYFFAASDPTATTENAFSKLIQQLIGNSPSSNELAVGKYVTDASGSSVKDASGSDVVGLGYDASGNPITGTSSVDWQGDIQQIKNMLSNLYSSNGTKVKDKQNCDVVNYNLDSSQQQGCKETDTVEKVKIQSLSSPYTKSACLEQGKHYTGTSNKKPACPYAQAQRMAKTAQPYPIDMNDYIRKDSIPCYGCNIK
jgi:hypothetical protein